MTDRTVRVVLTATGTQYSATFAAAGRTAERTAATVQTSMTQAATRSEAALTSTATAASRATAEAGTRIRAAAGEIPAAFRAAGAAGASALGQLDVAASASAASIQRAVARTAEVSTAAAGATTEAGTAAAGATRTVATAAGQIPAAFRAAGASATTALGSIDAGAAASVASLRGVTTTMSAATVAAATTQGELSLATRLTISSAAAASSAAATAAAATTRMSTSASLAASGASRASAAAAASVARTTATSAALSSTFGGVAARARTMGTSIVTAAGRSEASLRGTRTASLLLVAAVGAAVYASTKFESAMSQVKAATQAGSGELGKLRSAAIAAGAATQYSATEAADGITELAKAGVSTSDILGGALTGTLSLAAAGQMNVADSAVIAAKAMNSFGLKGQDMAHIADVIAAAAGKSATDVHGMSLAFAQSSLLAHQTGLSLEQTAGALALFAQNGLVGSDAGTSLKTMLMRLTPQSDQARGMMMQLGFSAYDASGKFVGLNETAARMQKAFAGLTPEARNAAMGVIFGSDAIRAATIVSQAGAAGIDTWTKAANDQGYASRYAATMTDNLAGDLERLKGSIETALIQSGTAANGVLRSMAQHLSGLINWYIGLPPAVQKSVTVFGGLAGTVGLATTALLLMLPRIMAVRTELVALGLTAARTRTLMAGLGRLTLVIGVLTAMSYATNKISDAMKATPPNIDRMTSSLIDLANTGKVSGEAAKAFGKDLDGFGEAVHRIAHAGGVQKVADEMSKLPLIGGDSGGLAKAKDQVKSIDQALADLVASGNAKAASEAFEDLSKDAEDQGTSTKKLMTLLPKYQAAQDAATTSSKVAAQGQKDLGDEAATTADQLQDDRTEVEKLKDALDALNGANISAAQAAIDFQGSLADLKQSVKDNGLGMDITTDKGRKMKSAFLDAANAALKHAEAVTEQTNSQEAGQKALTSDIDLLKKQMGAAGFTTDAIENLTAAYLKVPGQVTTKLDARTARAVDDLEALKRKLTSVPAGKSITVKAPSSGAIESLQAIGYKVKTLPNHQVQITAPTTSVKSNLAALQRQIDGLRGKTVDISVVTTHTSKGTVSHEGGNYSYGGIVGRAADGLYIPGYAPRVDDQLIMASRGEGVLVPEAVRAFASAMSTGPAQAVAAINRWGRSGGPAPMAAGRFGSSSGPAAGGSALGGLDVHVHFNDPALANLIDVRVEPKLRASEQRAAYRAKVGPA